ncbi:MAG TPA: hypothetical protein VGA08_02205 [Candidatus Saccharimonadales bacterium]
MKIFWATMFIMLFLLVAVVFMKSQYDSGANGTLGEREGMWAVFKTAFLLGGAFTVYMLTRWVAPGTLNYPWTVAVGMIAAWLSRGFVEDASGLQGGTLGVGIGIRVLVAGGILVAVVVLTLHSVWHRSRREVIGD